jgi:hypothetical protein
MEAVFPIVFALAIGIGFAVGTGTIADRKGYNFVLFAFLGLFFGLIAILVALILPRKKPAYDLG